MSLLALVATLHDPDGRLRPLAEPFVQGWLERFREVVILASPGSMGGTGAWLRAAGVRVVEDAQPQGVEQMGRVRLRALQAAAEGDHPYYLLMDFDRLAHWEATFPAELRYAEQAVLGYDFLILGRTARAFSTHPEAQRETERLANAAFAATFGEPLDITGGQRGLSAVAVAALSVHSRCATLGVDGEWPVLCRRLWLRLGYFRAEGLEYETADRFAAERAELGEEGWLALHINTPEQWTARLRLAWQIAAATQDASERVLETETPS